MIKTFEEERMNRKLMRKRLESYRDILRNDPSNLEAHESLIQSLFSLGRLDDAFEECRVLLGIAPENPVAYWIMGNIYSKRMHYLEGEKYLRKTLELAPSFFQAYVDLGANLLCQQRAEEGKTEIQRCVKSYPNYWRAHYNLSIAYMMESHGKEGFQEAQLAWNKHMSVRTFLQLVMTYDDTHKKWSMWLAYGLMLLALIISNVYMLPFLVLAIARMLITVLYFVQGGKKAEGYITLALVVAVILVFIERFHR